MVHESQEIDIGIPFSLWKTLKAHLIRTETGDDNEQLAFLFASPNRTPFRTRLLVRAITPAEPRDLVEQSPGSIVPTNEFVLAALNHCRDEGLHLIEVHSHPFSQGDGTTFSGIDWENDRGKMPPHSTLIDDFIHATMVIGQESLDAHFYHRKTNEILPVSRVVIVGGTDQLRYVIPTSARKHNKSPSLQRYARQELFLGSKTQVALQDTTVAIVGLGGLGSFVALELAHLGVGHLILIDPDHVEETNLNRLIGAKYEDIGRSKVEVYKQLIETGYNYTTLSKHQQKKRQFFPRFQDISLPFFPRRNGQISSSKNIPENASPVHVTALTHSILDSEAVNHAKGADILLGCVDNHGARLVLNQLAIRYMIPFLDSGSGIYPKPLAVGGQIHLVLPGLGCLECRRFIDPVAAAFDLAPAEKQQEARERGYGIGEDAPSVIFLNGVIASLLVAEVVFLLSGDGIKGTASPAPMTVYDALRREVLPANPQPTPYCITCGEEGVLGLGDLSPIRPATYFDPSELHT